ncbi:MAG TPA: HEAT repeat domain-containing protein [Candidatus Dormibacteraeota bacterium]|nr:HEAT repeat domain-containing protein [Candidatus Dormibacteraeota bacterium]
MNTRPPVEIDLQRLTKRSGAGSRGPRSRLATQIERVLNAALAGEPHVVLNVTSAEVLAEPYKVGAVVVAALEQAGPGLSGQWRVTEPFRRSGLSDQLLNSLVSPNPLTRAAAARLCGSLRLTESVVWIEDLVQDKNPKVRESAIRALGLLGGRRAVEALMASADRIPTHRLAIALSMAASDLDIEALMRRPASEKAAVVTVLACGLRRDTLRVQPLLGIAHDRRWPKPVRIAACKALGMIGDPAASDGIRTLVQREPDANVKNAAMLAQKRLHASPEARSA